LVPRLVHCPGKRAEIPHKPPTRVDGVDKTFFRIGERRARKWPSNNESAKGGWRVSQLDPAGWPLATGSALRSALPVLVPEPAERT
jgi:hypothetical protein